MFIRHAGHGVVHDAVAEVHYGHSRWRGKVQALYRRCRRCRRKVVVLLLTTLLHLLFLVLLKVRRRRVRRVALRGGCLCLPLVRGCGCGCGCHREVRAACDEGGDTPQGVGYRGVEEGAFSHSEPSSVRVWFHGSTEYPPFKRGAGALGPQPRSSGCGRSAPPGNPDPPSRTTSNLTPAPWR